MFADKGAREENLDHKLKELAEAVEENAKLTDPFVGIFYALKAVVSNTDIIPYLENCNAIGNMPSIQLLIGYAYYVGGQGVAKNYEKTVEYCTKAAELGHAPAMDLLGHCYKTGHGVAQNYGKAAEYCTKAAELGDALAMRNLAICYKHGIGFKKDPAKALFWYQEAADHGHPTAQDDYNNILDAVQKDFVPVQKKIRSNTSHTDQCRQYLKLLSGFSLGKKHGEKVAFQLFINTLTEPQLFKCLGGLKHEELQNTHLFEALWNRPGMKMAACPLKTIKKDTEGNRIYADKPFITSDKKQYTQIPRILADLLVERKDLFHAMDTLPQWKNGMNLPTYVQMQILSHLDHGSLPVDPTPLRQALSEKVSDSNILKLRKEKLESDNITLKQHGKNTYKKNSKGPSDMFTPSALNAIKKTWEQKIENQKTDSNSKDHRQK